MLPCGSSLWGWCRPPDSPPAHEVFEGNIAEATTVMGMVRSLAKRFPLQRVVVVADRRMISWDNLEQLEAMEISPGRPAEYIVAVPGPRFRSLHGEIFQLRQELVAASRASGGEVVRERAVDGRRLVVAYSPEVASRMRHQLHRPSSPWRCRWPCDLAGAWKLRMKATVSAAGR